MGESSATGVAFSRNPATGENIYVISRLTLEVYDLTGFIMTRRSQFDQGVQDSW